MYEAIVGPTFNALLKEAVKIPAIDRLVNQTDMVCIKTGDVLQLAAQQGCPKTLTATFACGLKYTSDAFISVWYPACLLQSWLHADNQ